MEEAKRFSAQNRVFDALYSLLAEKPCRKIKVTELVALAGINRGTFYKHFESVPDLLQKAQDRLCSALLNLSVPQPETAEQLKAFTKALFAAFLRGHETQVRLLGGENGDLRTFWLIGTAMQTRLQREADALGARDEGVRRNIDGAPGFFASFLCQNVYQNRLRSIWPTLTSFPYCQDLTFFENAARQLQQRRGGSVFFHYDLLLAYVKFYDSYEPQVSVTKLLEAAGINRTEFYLYFRNFEDFRQTYSDVMYACASLFCREICCAAPKQAVELIASFSEINYSFVQRAFQGVLERGDIILYFTILISSVYTLLARQSPVYPDAAQTVRLQLLYEIGSTISYTMTYYMGQTDKETLKNNLERLDGLRRSLLAGGEELD